MTKRIRGLAIGTFDLFHAGHVNFLRQCRERCDELVVAINPDSFALAYKRQPICTTDERFAVVQSCKYVDLTTINHGEADSRQVISATQADRLFHGDDWMGDSLKRQLGLDDEWLERNGVELVYVPYTATISSSEIEMRVRLAIQ